MDKPIAHEVAAQLPGLFPALSASASGDDLGLVGARPLPTEEAKCESSNADSCSQESSSRRPALSVARGQALGLRRAGEQRRARDFLVTSLVGKK